VKRWFTILSLLAITHVVALAGGVAYAWSQDWLNKDRVRQAVAVLRGEQDDGPDDTEQEPDVVEPPKSAGERIRRNVETDERARIELARREREIQDRWHQLEARQLAFLREREAFDQQQRRHATQQKEKAEQAGDSGLKKELEIVAGLKAKNAKALLRLKDDADVVRILMALEVRQARKIVGACKTDEERSWIERILGKLHEQNADQAEVLDVGS
jgi:hypothetical protein